MISQANLGPIPPYFSSAHGRWGARPQGPPGPPRAPGCLFANIHRIAGIVHHPHAAPPRGDVRLGGGHVLGRQHLLGKAMWMGQMYTSKDEDEDDLI